MSPAQPATCDNPPTAPAAGPGLGRRLARSAVRLALIGGVVWMGWSTATTLTEVCSGPRSPQPPAPEPSPTSESSVLQWLSAAQGGQWRFAGTPLRLRFHELSARQVRAEMDLRPQGGLPGGKLRQAGQQALALLKSLKAPRRRTEHGGLYSLDRPEMMVRLFTRGQGASEELVAGRLALLFESRWIILETGSEREETPASEDSAGSLLPLPAGAERICDRCDPQGRPLAEVFSVPTTWPLLRQHWQREGWSVTVSLDSDRGVAATCQRDGRTIQILARETPGPPCRLFVVLICAPA